MKVAIAICLLFVLGASAVPQSEQSGQSVSSSHNVHASAAQQQPPQAPAGIVNAVESGVVVPHGSSQPVVSQYAPAGVVQVVGGPQPISGVSGKPVPVGGVSTFKNEQYGQPESAAIPSNYKPFGSWGLYIGGNPADGYYTNYYKSLSNSVEKVSGSGEKPSAVSALQPILKQASSSPYQGADYYPFSYASHDFVSNSGPMVVPQVFGGASVPASVVEGPVSYIPEMYATKSRTSSPATKSVSQQQLKDATKSAKSVQQVYHYQVDGSLQPQVVAYPVPVGSQIVGSQVGVDGAFYPYGVHAFTKYAVKPTRVGGVDASGYQQPSAVSGSQVQNVAGVYSPGQLSVVHPTAYKYNNVHAPVQVVPASYSQQQYPYSQYYYQVPQQQQAGQYYSYPASQLHYSNGLVVPHSGYDSIASPSPVSQPITGSEDDSYKSIVQRS